MHISGGWDVGLGEARSWAMTTKGKHPFESLSSLVHSIGKAPGGFPIWSRRLESKRPAVYEWRQEGFCHARRCKWFSRFNQSALVFRRLCCFYTFCLLRLWARFFSTI
jgi:hypothetical protein